MAVCLFGISSPEPLHYCPSSHPGPSFSCPEYKYTEHMAAHKTHNTQPQGLSREVRPLIIPILAQDLRENSRPVGSAALWHGSQHFSAFQPRIDPF